MTGDIESQHRAYVQFAGGSGVLTAIIGTLVIFGWWLHIELLTSLAPGLASMKANTALCFILAGISLRLQCLDPLPHHESHITLLYAARALGGAVALLGVLSLIEYLANVNLGIDELLFTDFGRPSANPPGRMAPATATNFILLGGALVQCNRKVPGHVCEWFAVLVLISGLIAIVGYLYGVQELYRIAPYASVALHTAVLFVLLACGVMASRPAQGLMKTFTSTLAGGASARRILPWVLGAPIVLGGVRLWGQREGLYGTEFGLALFAISNVLVLATVVYLSARALNASAAEINQQLELEKRAEQQLRESQELLLSQNRVLHMVATGACLTDSLSALLRLVEDRSPGWLASILLLDETGTRLRHGAAPSLPEEYSRAFDGAVIGPEAGSCGTAAYRRETVIVTDIQADPLWANYRDLAARFGLRACWSTPIIGSSGRVLGTFAMYYRTPRYPEPGHEEVINFVTQTVILAIEHQDAFDALRASETRYRTLGDNSPDVIARYDRALRFVYVNRAIEAATGIAPEQFSGKTFVELGMPQPHSELWTATLRQVFATGQPKKIEFDYLSPGGIRSWEGIAVAERNPRGEIESALAISRDITARKEAEAEHDKYEARLRQAHKLQALGTLAGGIAHDFNNMLMIISGNAALARGKIPAGDAIHKNLGEIETAGARAADLVKRILAFSRPQDVQRKPLQLRPIIEETLQLLRATIPATIQIQTHFGPGSSNVLADATQLQQVIMNLGVNAAHAMRERGGILAVRLEPVTVDAMFARSSPNLHVGQYERVTVTDTGTGMDAATLERIFEPFYTTKGVGEGTGLGLSVAHGIMLGHGGGITVTSQPLKGSTFCLYFPAVASEHVENGLAEVVASVAGQRERVLFVDDEESLVLLITRVLEQQNYQVTGVSDPGVALAKFSATPREFDVLVTDIAMPGMSGFDLVRAIRKIRPELPVIVTTGYIRPEDSEIAHSLGISRLILKPDTIEELGKTLQTLFGMQRSESA